MILAKRNLNLCKKFFTSERHKIGFGGGDRLLGFENYHRLIGV
jgi:hypothetical protein